ncbi:MAG: DUF4209 domain-containing protein [Proteobacteria bacterium]|nr:DUF4209 domain-containing protein [Pseudomonadota bacterium]
MTDQGDVRKDVFSGDLEHLDSIDVEAPLASSRGSACTHFFDEYLKAVKQATDSGDENGAAIYSFLRDIASFYPKFDTPEEPFGPMWRFEGRRSCLPCDLSADDLAAVQKLAGVVRSPALLARLYDILWIIAKNHKDCMKAAESYLNAAEILAKEKNWIPAVESFHRGLYLASKLGRDKELFTRTSDRLQRVIRAEAPNSNDFLCCQLMSLLIQFRCGDHAKFAELASDIAKKAHKEDDPYRERGYWEVAADLFKCAKDDDSEAEARLAASETYVQQAEQRTEGERGSYMAAASILRDGIEGLRRAKADTSRVAELRKTLTEYQEKSLAERNEYSTEIDLTESVEAARKHVEDADFYEACFKLTMGPQLVDLSRLREEVVDLIRKFPMQNLFAHVKEDEKARPTATAAGISPSDDVDEQQLELKLFSHLRTTMTVRVASYIDPARQQVATDHHPKFSDLVEIVRHNPFIPPGHEEIFLRGIHAGFHEDWVTASHLLVPQIENSLRFVLEAHDVDVSNLLSDGTQPVMVLGAIFDMAETKEIFGEPLCFELRCCLIEKMGFDFRNRVAHGFASDEECRSAAARYLWWLVLRLCLTPMWNAKVNAAGEDQ